MSDVYRPSWAEIHMVNAIVVSCRSPDAVMKVGAVIIGEDENPISIGYNGSPYGSEWPENDADKHCVVVHAELNAILHAKQSLKNAIMYTTLFPCLQCAKAIVQAGIKRVIYLQVKDGPNYQIEKAKNVLRNKNVEVTGFHEISDKDQFLFYYDSIFGSDSKREVKCMINCISWDYNKKEKLKK